MKTGKELLKKLPCKTRKRFLYHMYNFERGSFRRHLFNSKFDNLSQLLASSGVMLEHWNYFYKYLVNRK